MSRKIYFIFLISIFVVIVSGLTSHYIVVWNGKRKIYPKTDLNELILEDDTQEFMRSINTISALS